jgi:hypothetical protein
LYTSVASSADPMNRALLLLRSENDWQCLKCVRTSDCMHKTACNVFKNLNAEEFSFDIEWLMDEAIVDTTVTWEAPHVRFPVDSLGQFAVRGFDEFSSFEPETFEPTQLNCPLCDCAHNYNMSEPNEKCSGKVYGLFSTTSISVPVFPCSNTACTNELQFDGMFHGFLRGGKETFWDLDLVNVIRFNLIMGTTPMSGAFRVIEASHTTRGSEL